MVEQKHSESEKMEKQADEKGKDNDIDDALEGQDRPGDAKSEVKKEEKKKISAEQQHIDELTDMIKRIQADFENYQKRMEKERKDFAEYACIEMARSLLPVLDSFELAIKNSDNEDVKVIYGQLWQILGAQGLEKIDALGEKFDPYLHEALMQEKSKEKEEGIVLEVLQPGYRFKDNLIRAAKVKVAK